MKSTGPIPCCETWASKSPAFQGPRQLLKKGILPVLALALLLTVASADSAPSSSTAAETVRSHSQAVGRPVRIVSLCFYPNKTQDEILKAVREHAVQGSDLIVLPETWKGQSDQSAESIAGPAVKALSSLAKEYRTYIICPLDLERDARRFNTAVLINRDGTVIGQYDKVFPYWSEYDLKQPVQPGARAPVFETDFGRVGMAICFDVNFPEVWQELADRGAEVVIWPSAYSAGKHLGAYSLLHHYYIVTATYTGDCQVYDITGERLLDERGDGIHVSRVTLDLDRGIYHSNFNDLDGFLRKHSKDVVLEQYLPREAWYVVKAIRPGVSVRKLAREFGLEELRDYIHRSRLAIGQKRASQYPAAADSRK